MMQSASHQFIFPAKGRHPYSKMCNASLRSLFVTRYPYSKMCNVCNVCNVLTNKSKRYCTVYNARYTHCLLRSQLCRCAPCCALVVISRQFAAILVLFVGRRYYLRPIIRCFQKTECAILTDCALFIYEQNTL